MWPDSPRLCSLTLPSKRRHGHFSKVEVSFSFVFRDGHDVLQDRVQHARRDHHATVVVEDDDLLAGAVFRSTYLADRMQRTADLSQVLVAADLPVPALVLG